jgi:hypothetical protein
MRLQLALGFLAALGASIGAVASTPAPPAQPAQAVLQSLAWLAGCWQSDDGEPGSGEQWMPPAAGTMLGVGRTVAGGATRSFEFMRIHTLADGRLAFTAYPSGQSPGTFPLLRASVDEVVFENLQHDFPQRVIYRLDAPGRLAARIEGVSEGKPLTVPFNMSRVACAAGAG